MINDIKLDVFISGELVDLCIPTEEFAKNSDWYSWFNNKKITRYSFHGSFPNTPEKQAEFFRNRTEKELVLIVQNKKKKKYIGVISLSNINLVMKECDISLILNNSIPYLSLESMSLLTEYAFLELGIKRINAGQHFELSQWQKQMELIGYKVEGILSNKFVKGDEVADVIKLSCIYDDYCAIRDIRGKLWDSVKNMYARHRAMPEKSFYEQLSSFFSNERDGYYRDIFKL